MEGSPTGGRIGGGTLNAWDNCINDFINHGDAIIIIIIIKRNLRKKIAHCIYKWARDTGLTRHSRDKAVLIRPPSMPDHYSPRDTGLHRSTTPRAGRQAAPHHCSHQDFLSGGETHQDPITLRKVIFS